jgi:hypothetical protein
MNVKIMEVAWWPTLPIFFVPPRSGVLDSPNALTRNSNVLKYVKNKPRILIRGLFLS